MTDTKKQVNGYVKNILIFGRNQRRKEVIKNALIIGAGLVVTVILSIAIPKIDINEEA